VLVVTVLLQPGKADAGALFSSGISSTAFGPRGTQSILAKITIGAAAAFMLFALTLGLPIVTGSRSVLQSEEEPAPVASPSPAATQQAPAAIPEASAQPAANTSAPAASPATSPAAKSSPATNASPSAKK
jgi:preprotein translocase subunit SecG